MQKLSHLSNRNIKRYISKAIALVSAVAIASTGLYAITRPDDSMDAVEAAQTSPTPHTDAQKQVLAKHEVPTVNIPTAKMNMFDYVLNDKDDEPSGAFDTGINEGHAFVFTKGVSQQGNKQTLSGTTYSATKTMNDTGAWNDWTGNDTASPNYKIMKPLLGDDGYPILNLTDNVWTKTSGTSSSSAWSTFNKYHPNRAQEESMAYLFDPNYHDEQTDAYRKDYTNLRGLFQLNSDGQYFFDSGDNYAHLNKETKRFTVYDTPAFGTDSRGFFFPLEDIALAFSGNETTVNKVTKLERGKGNPSQDVTDNNAIRTNHFSSFTFEMPFYMPTNGKIQDDNGKEQDMTFTFSGDDDVWVYIDGVLVGDLGGNHNEIRLEINFATGDVDVYSAKTGNEISNWKSTTYANHSTDTTIKQMFASAYGTSTSSSTIGGVRFNGNTFASNTTHTIKMFYLERGNTANMSLSFNIQTPKYQQISKETSDGDPIPGIEYEMYAATPLDGETISDTTASASQFKVASTPTLTTKTGEDGIANFADADGSPYSFADAASKGNIYYLLHETNVPDGLRTPDDIILRYDQSSEMLLVLNPYQSSAMSAFTSTTTTSSVVHYANTTGSNIGQATSTTITDNTKAASLILAVPAIKGSNQDYGLYGSNTTGWNRATTASTSTTTATRDSVIRAALYQAARDDAPDWNFDYNSNTKKLTATLDDLPGHADQYTDDGNLNVYFLVISPTALNKLGVIGNNGDDMVSSLRDRIKEAASSSKGNDDDEKLTNAVNSLATTIAGTFTASGTTAPSGFLARSDVNSVFRSFIHASNIGYSLDIIKTDEDGTPVPGATIGIYNTESAAQNRISPIASLTTDENGYGKLTIDPFASYATHSNIANIPYSKTLYLAEIAAPDGYLRNDSIVECHVDNDMIHANAGTKDDGIEVSVSAPSPSANMTSRAAGGGFSSTLDRLYANRIILDSWDTKNGNNTWKSIGEHESYAYSKSDGKYTILEYTKLATVDTGYVSASFVQAPTTDTWSPREDLGDADLMGALVVSNTVHITDLKDEGDLSITVSLDNRSDEVLSDTFSIYIPHFTDRNGNPLSGTYQADITSTDETVKSVEIKIDKGRLDVDLSAGESIVIYNLPGGAYIADGNDGVQEYRMAGYEYSVSGAADTIGKAFAISRDSTVDISVDNVYRAGYLDLKKTVTGKKDFNTEALFSFQLDFYSDKDCIKPIQDDDFRAIANGGIYNKPEEIENGGTIKAKMGSAADADIVHITVPSRYDDIWVKVTEIEDPNYDIVNENDESNDIVEEGTGRTIKNALGLNELVFKLPQHKVDDDSGENIVPMVAFRNYVKSGRLAIQKSLQNNVETMKDVFAHRKFDFSVSLFFDPEHTRPLGQEYNYEIYDSDNVMLESGTVKHGGIVKLAQDEMCVITDLPAGTYYIANESKNIGFMPDNTANNASGTIDPDGLIEMPFVNIYSPNVITISKTVIDPDDDEFTAPEDDTFKFLFYLTDKDGNVYKGPALTYYGNDNLKGELTGDGDIIELKDGQYITFECPNDDYIWRVEEVVDMDYVASAKKLYGYDLDKDEYTKNTDGIVDEDSGKAVIEGIMSKDGENSLAQEAAFTNEYRPVVVELPFTGLSLGLLVGIGSVLIVIGMLLVFSTTRPKRSLMAFFASKPSNG